MRCVARSLTLVLLAACLLGADKELGDKDLIQPDQAAKQLKAALVIHVGFPVLYRSVHITGTTFAGPGSKAEGIADLKKAVAGQPHDRGIILYCGCCPFDKCPNIRPAIAALHEMGFTHVKAMMIETNLKTDWIDKGFPTDKHAE